MEYINDGSYHHNSCQDYESEYNNYNQVRHFLFFVD